MTPGHAAGRRDEPVALRRIAGLLRQGVAIDEILAAAVAEAGAVTHAELAAVTRYDADRPRRP